MRNGEKTDAKRLKSQSKMKQMRMFGCLQLLVLFYTISGVAGKIAASYDMQSWLFYAFYAVELCILFVYAILWQQIIKRIDLSVAYANRALAIFWSMLWAAFLFKETISLQNIIGVIVVAIGIMLVNGGAYDE